MDKVELLTRVLQAKDRGLTMIFARTKRTVQRVADDLADRGFAAAAVHGDLGQGAREQALRAFRSGKVDVLVATDVAARGIDVTDVTHVVNYQCPEDAKTYVHRIGRTGRAGKTGVAVTLVDWDELHSWKTISDDLGLDMPEAPETYSTSRAPLQRPRDPRRRQGPPAALAAHPGRAWTPSTSTPRATTAGAGVASPRPRPRTPRRCSAGRRGAAGTSAQGPGPQPRRSAARGGRVAGGGRADRCERRGDGHRVRWPSMPPRTVRSTVRTPTRPSPAGVAAVAAPGVGAVPTTALRESAPADSAPDAAAS